MNAGCSVDAAAWVTGPEGDDRRYCVPDINERSIGGEGLTYRARDRATDQPVALKMLTELPFERVPVLRRRSAVVAAVHHAHLMRQLDLFVGTALRHPAETPEPADFDVPYSVAEWVDGQSLGERTTGWSTAQALGCLVEIGRALVVLHGHRSPDAPDGVVHRDLKPSNVRIRPDGTAVLVDFGVARPVAADMSRKVGSYRWRSPELALGDGHYTTASDMWGLGALAHWVLTGDPPLLDGAAVAGERMRLAAESSDLARPAPVVDHITRLLETRPVDRPNDLAAWLDEFEWMIATAGATDRLPCRTDGPAGDAPLTTTRWVAEVWADTSWHAHQGSDSPCPPVTEPLVIPLEDREVVIGRVKAGRDANVINCRADMSVSRRHAQLCLDGQRWWIEDVGSANGTYVSRNGALPGRPLAPRFKRVLEDDDCIYVGAWTRIVIRTAGRSEET
jgi:serine/threonine protein kinase